MSHQKNTNGYNLYIDTGGTFTDCIAETREGNILRRKILSSSAIRGIAEVDHSQSMVNINLGESFPDDFFSEYRFSLLSNPDQIFTIESYNSDTSSVALQGGCSSLPEGVHPFEIQSPEEAPVFAARLITKTRIGEGFPHLNMRLSTTKGTNALLERKGSKTLFLITEGFKDLLHIRNQQRPDLFSLNIQKPQPYYRYIIEVPERVDAKGKVLKPLNSALLRKKIDALNGDFDAAGICLMHGYLNPDHEKEIEALLREMGVRSISRSSALSQTIKIVPRAITTDVNAFLSPVMDNYLERISEVLGGNRLHVMTSAGSLAESESYTPKDGLLSGPAGGVIGAVAIAKRIFKDLSDQNELNAHKDPSDLPPSETQTSSDVTDLKRKNPTDLNELAVPEDPSDLPPSETQTSSDVTDLKRKNPTDLNELAVPEDPSDLHSPDTRAASDITDPKKENPTDLLNIISFDMGGTSTDVARFGGSIGTIYEHTVGDATLTAPAVDIETVAAGGGSICDFDGISLTVGPESAGADPGPACYGRGGPLTITDVNLLSGRLHPANFHISILPEVAEKAFLKIEEQVNNNRITPLGRAEILEGFLDIANERMAQAIRKISIQKGFDPSVHTLVAFGGAGAQHALAVAGKLKMKRVLVPSDAGLLSAYGLRQARLEQFATQQVLKPLSGVEKELPSILKRLENEAGSGLDRQGVNAGDREITRRELFLRFMGQDTSLEIEWYEGLDIRSEFQKMYESHYGHWIEDRKIELEAVRVKVSEAAALRIEKQTEHNGNRAADAVQGSRFLRSGSDSASGEYKIHHSDEVEAGTQLMGPALILNPWSTTVIDSGWRGTLLPEGTWLLTKQGKKDPADLQSQKTGHLSGSRAPRKENPPDLEAINLQLYTNRFRSVADQMGEMLRKTSISVNVKERLDFSCALLDREGYLVVNAPHIPVHLGAMGSCVRTVMQWLREDPADFHQKVDKNTSDSSASDRKNPPDRELSEGDVIITNHPAFGGSHLPDVTVITPVFSDGEHIGFVTSRAHHAEIGGKRPGSMPPDANNLAEEGVVIPPLFLAKKGVFDWVTITTLLKNGEWPSRSTDENLADLRAAVTANHCGVTELKKLAGLHGKKQVTNYMRRLKEYASGRMRSTLKKIPDGTYSAKEKMDDGSLLKVNCRVEKENMSIDFSGTSGVHPGNLNANPSIVNSVVIYVLRLMINEPLPLNDGLLESVELTIPEGMLNPVFHDDPKECPAVVGGNIETSQRLTDTLLKAFGLAACSYGTMNNVLFGNETFGYYETVGGGTGAGNGFDGADAVHQHMTNTRAADPEILEHRYPVRIDRYSIRKNSGGTGRWKGGDGIIRELTFTEPVSLSVLSQHRVVKPYGLNKGKPGETGFQHVIKSDGRVKELKWRDGEDLEAGDRFILHTPGGGGYSE
jgi:5-oxoprolinase (ATP-hydrolysing)